jgi:hypothetical protein
MCWDHWRQVPGEIKNCVSAAWHSGDKSAHRVAVVAAVGFLHKGGKMSQQPINGKPYLDWLASLEKGSKFVLVLGIHSPGEEDDREFRIGEVLGGTKRMFRTTEGRIGRGNGRLLDGNVFGVIVKPEGDEMARAEKCAQKEEEKVLKIYEEGF